MRPKREKKIRLTIDLPIKTRERLEFLQKLTEADTMTEVVRRALNLYEFLWENRGNVVIRKDGKDTEIILL